MEFSVTSLITMPVTTFCPSQSSTVSYVESYFGVLEACTILFWGFCVWHGTIIRDKCFSVMVLVWFFCDKPFVIDYIFCEVVCIYFLAFFFLYQSFSLWSFTLQSFIFLLLCLLFLFLCYYLWFSCNGISWHVQVCHGSDILVRSHFLYASIPLTCSRIYHKLFMYTCIGILRKGIFHFYWCSWTLLFFSSVIFRQNLVMNPLNS